MSTVAAPLAGKFTADPEHSSFQFAVKHMTVAIYRATFDDVTATVNAGQDGIELVGGARVSSITIKDPQFRGHVVEGPEFFDASNHPEIGFRSADVELDETGGAKVKGELSMRGVSREVEASGTYQPAVADPFGKVRAALQLIATIDRRDWGMDWQHELPKGGDVLGWEVELTVDLALVAEEAAE
jgi:polyisoprenoid-binding protein YceI